MYIMSPPMKIKRRRMMPVGTTATAITATYNVVESVPPPPPFGVVLLAAACAAGEDVTSACAATAKRGGVVRGGVVRRTPTGGCGYVALRAALWMCGLSPTIGKRTRQKTQKTQSKCRGDWHQKSRRCRRPRMGGGCGRGSRPLASGELTS